MNIKLEQLRLFKAVIEHGGVNSAAQAIHKSPSAISNALSTFQDQIGVQLFETQGRKLVLTKNGKSILGYTEQVLQDQQALIEAAKRINNVQHESLSIAVDVIYPQEKLLGVLGTVTTDQPWCKIRVEEHVLSGVEEAVASGNADIGIAYRIPEGFVGRKIIDIPFITVAAPNHPLSSQKAIQLRELKKHRQVVIADSGKQSIDSGWLKAHYRWTTSNLYSALNVALSGFAYARIPLHMAQTKIKEKQLVVLDVDFDFEKTESLYAFASDPECTFSHQIIDLLGR